MAAPPEDFPQAVVDMMTDEVKSAMSLSLYQYKPLSQSKREIRLLRIENFQELRDSTVALNEFLSEQVPENLDLYNFMWSGNIPVRCAIEHVSLDIEPVYSALSYTWGDPNHRVPIIVNGDARLMVTKNLNQALRHIFIGMKSDGGEVQSCRLWIDAICINQADNKEKSWQVQMMWNIYHESSLTAVWLGAPFDGSDALFQLIEEIDVTALRHLDRVRLIENTPKWIQGTGIKLQSLSFSALSSFIHLPYWSRVWIQQELQAGNECQFFCGFKSISRLNILAIGVIIGALLKATEQGIKILGSEIQEELALLDERSWDLFYYATLRFQDRKPTGKPAITLEQTLQDAYVTGYGLQAGRPEDLIYALLNLTSDSAELGIVPDYSKSHLEVYTKVAKTLIETAGIHILRYCNVVGDELPSWAPDWRQPILRPFEMAKSQKTYRYSAAKNLKTAFYFEDAQDQFPILNVHGKMMDGILVTGRPLEDPNAHNPGFKIENILTYLEWMLEPQYIMKAIPFYDVTRPYSDIETKQALWRTPIADIEPDKSLGWIRARSTFEKVYDDALDDTVKSADTTAFMKYLSVLRTFCHGRKFFVTEKGYLGLGPRAMKEGDFAVIIGGLQVPMVLRVKEDGCFQILGEAYVHGFMDGEGPIEIAQMDFKIR
jgi:Heterokaryon incompatibility protein (HET)